MSIPPIPDAHIEVVVQSRCFCCFRGKQPSPNPSPISDRVMSVFRKTTQETEDNTPPPPPNSPRVTQHKICEG